MAPRKWLVRPPEAAGRHRPPHAAHHSPIAPHPPPSASPGPVIAPKAFASPEENRPCDVRRSRLARGLANPAATVALLVIAESPAVAAEPDPKSYWDVDDIRPGMKGTGQTVMVGTKLEEFGAEVLGGCATSAPAATWSSAG